MIRSILILIVAFQLNNYSQVKLDKQTEKPISLTETLKSDFIYSFNTVFEVLKSPLSFDNSDLIMTSIVLAAAGASMSIENQVRSDVLKMSNSSLDRFTGITERFGRPIYGGILSGLFYSSGILFADNYVKETGQMLAEAIITNGIYTQLLKIALGRARPFTNEPNTEIDFLEFEFESKEHSLPSGHTSTAFTIATILSERFNNIYASLTLYSLASLTAFQRIYSDVHWLSDVVLGAALGTFIGLKIVKLHETTSASSENYNIKIYPQINPNGYGVGFSMNL